MICAVKCFWCNNTIELVAHPNRTKFYRDYSLCPHCIRKNGTDTVMVYAVTIRPEGKALAVEGRQRTLNGVYPTGDYFVVKRADFLHALMQHAPDFYKSHHEDIATAIKFSVSPDLFHEMVNWN